MAKNSGSIEFFMTYRLYKRLSDLIDFESNLKKKYKQEIPAIPIRKEHEISKQNLGHLAEFFGIFIKKVVNVAFYDPEFEDFFNFFPTKFGRYILI